MYLILSNAEFLTQNEPYQFKLSGKENASKASFSCHKNLWMKNDIINRVKLLLRNQESFAKKSFNDLQFWLHILRVSFLLFLSYLPLQKQKSLFQIYLFPDKNLSGNNKYYAFERWSINLLSYSQ